MPRTWYDILIIFRTYTLLKNIEIYFFTSTDNSIVLSLNQSYSIPVSIYRNIPESNNLVLPPQFFKTCLCDFIGPIVNSSKDALTTDDCLSLIPPDRPDLNRYCIGIYAKRLNHRYCIYY
jgi:hypothetical protein